ncbi:hypothetical protein D3C81_1728280 [compost metagenome]
MVWIVGPSVPQAVGLVVDSAVISPLGDLIARERACYATDGPCDQQTRAGFDASDRADRHAQASTGKAADAACTEVDQPGLCSCVIAFAAQTAIVAQSLTCVIGIQCKRCDTQCTARAYTGRAHAGSVCLE